MNQQEWERDVRNRQRNIVFPDTNLNEGRFYRNIASGKAIFTTGQRISLLLIVAFFTVVNVVDFASSLGVPLSEDRSSVRAWNLGPSLISLAWLLFWLFLTVKALFPPPPPAPKRRRGYRSSSRG
jgi:uncharacterized membrane protein (DUF485 family)